jgi:hypothetical protein
MRLPLFYSPASACANGNRAMLVPFNEPRYNH